MKTLKNLVLATMMLTTALSAQAEWVSGHFRSNGTYVAPYYRTRANGIVYDNLSYRGYPSQQRGYFSISGTSSTYGNTTYHNYQNSLGNALSGTTMRFGNTSYSSFYGW